jgi:hypothetical protein
MKANLFDLRAYAHHWHSVADAATLAAKAMHGDELGHAMNLNALTVAKLARSLAMDFDELVASIEDEGRAERE